MERDRSIGLQAITLGAVDIAGVTSLGLMFLVGPPFGTLNDLCNAAVSVLSARLAWSWSRRVRRHRATGEILAFGGAAIAVVGSALVVTDTTGFFLAGLVSNVGFALVGLWLIGVNRGLASDETLPRQLATLGLATGVVMALGLASIPGIVLGIDDMASAPGWIWIGSVGWTGTFVLYPIWALWFGRSLVQRAAPGSVV
jgi:hypothetical protein